MAAGKEREGGRERGRKQEGKTEEEKNKKMTPGIQIP